MTAEMFNAFCRDLPATAYVMQWRGMHVWKVGGKVFAFGARDGDDYGITFKVSPLAFEILKDRPGLRPAPYMASRGLTWLQYHGAPGQSGPELLDHLKASYDMVAAKLPRAVRRQIGLG